LERLTPIMEDLPKAITFDAAGTLVELHFDGPAFLADLARELGLAPDDELVEKHYGPVMSAHVQRYAEDVRAGRAKGGTALWAGIYEEVLRRAGAPMSDEQAVKLVGLSAQRLFGPGSEYWGLYPDVAEALQGLQDRGVRMAVVSNWDGSLHGVLERLGVYRRFEFVLASLEVGWEKPDPRLFGEAIERFGCEPFEVVHVGDNPVDDVRGAEAAGMFAVLLDREGAYDGLDCPKIATLGQLVELYE
jgi:putative hydrolase of the HAD superfamily